MDKPFYVIITSQDGDFKCTLPTPIELKGKYDVSVVEYVYDVNWINMEEATLIIVKAPGQEEVVTIPRGFFVSVEGWINK